MEFWGGKVRSPAAALYIPENPMKHLEALGLQGLVTAGIAWSTMHTNIRRYDTKEERMFDNLHNALVQFMTDYIWVRHQASSTNPSQFDSNQHAIKSRREETRLYFVM